MHPASNFDPPGELFSELLLGVFKGLWILWSWNELLVHIGWNQVLFPDSKEPFLTWVILLEYIYKFRIFERTFIKKIYFFQFSVGRIKDLVCYEKRSKLNISSIEFNNIVFQNIESKGICSNCNIWILLGSKISNNYKNIIDVDEFLRVTSCIDIMDRAYSWVRICLQQAFYSHWCS